MTPTSSSVPPEKKRATLALYYHHFQPGLISLLKVKSDQVIVSIKVSEIHEAFDVKEEVFSEERDNLFRSIMEDGREDELPPVFLELSDGTRKDHEGKTIPQGEFIPVDGRNRIRAKKLINPEGEIKAVIFYPLDEVERIVFGIWPNWGGPQAMSPEDIRLNVTRMMSLKREGGLGMSDPQVREKLKFIPTKVLSTAINLAISNLRNLHIAQGKDELTLGKKTADKVAEGWGITVKALVGPPPNVEHQSTGRPVAKGSKTVSSMKVQFKSIHTSLTHAVRGLQLDIKSHNLKVEDAVKQLCDLETSTKVLLERIVSAKYKVQRVGEQIPGNGKKTARR